MSNARTPSVGLLLGMLNSRGSFDRLSQPKPNRWGVAKLVRRLTLDQVILGSSPSAPAIVLSQRDPGRLSQDMMDGPAWLPAFSAGTNPRSRPLIVPNAYALALAG